jgi:ribosomal protein S18 acetylase RimI-like enzyme
VPARRWLTDAFELAELHVLPEQQGGGLGRRLLEAILTTAPNPTVVLSTHDRESAARSLYQSFGFVDLLRDFVFPGSPEVYAVMGLER